MAVVIAFSGDSITAFYAANGTPGLQDYQCYVRLVADTLGLGYRNSAIGGTRIDQAASTDLIGLDYDKIAGVRNIVTLFSGTNDIAQGASAATVQSRIQSWCSARYAAGWNKVVVATILPRNVVGFETVRITVNTWLRANYLTFCDGLADVGGDAVIGNASNLGNTQYYSDGIHPTALGHTLMQPYFQTTLAALI